MKNYSKKVKEKLNKSLDDLEELPLDTKIEILNCPNCNHYMKAFYIAPPISIRNFDCERPGHKEKAQDCYNCGKFIYFEVGKLETLTIGEINKLKEKGLWVTLQDQINRDWPKI